MFVHELILNLEYDFEIIFEEKTKEFKKKWQELILYCEHCQQLLFD